jgi:hypothetical protein
MIGITWVRGEARGTRDLIPSEWFEEEGSFPSKEHFIVDLDDSSFSRARCSVNVTDNEAILDYSGVHREFNVREDCDIGEMRILFDDIDRVTVKQVFWRDEGREFRKAPIRVEIVDDEGLLFSANEGRVKVVQHLERERSARLRRMKIKSVIDAGMPLQCEACGFDFGKVYPDIGDGYCEVHHRDWLASGNERRTKLEDLAVLCSNCHRMIHRTNLLSVESFAKLVSKN